MEQAEKASVEERVGLVAGLARSVRHPGRKERRTPLIGLAFARSATTKQRSEATRGLAHPSG